MSTETSQLAELFDRLDLSPGLKARLQIALRAHEAGAPVLPGAARFVEAVTPSERELLLGWRHWNDPDGYIAALQAGGR